jgi:MoaA/NifB/PqqE/SkfB family radical SAM enzyme
MEKKYFPIQTDTACQLKWAWSTLYLYSGDTASCHRTGWSTVSSETFESFHNTDKKISDRMDMLAGQWPTDSCQYCRDIESSGGVSDRMFHNSIPNLSPSELDNNFQATVVTPTILEIYFNNTCNLSCVYCLPTLSSKINSENKKFGVFESNGVSLKSVDISSDYTKTLDKFWQWFSLHSTELKRFQVLGGEPFYQQEFDKCIEYFESTKHPDLEWAMVTNLTIPLSKLEMYVERFKKLLIEKRLKRIEITCSIDCWGSEQEYVRWGLDLNTWEQNLEYLLKQKWLTVNINQTISLLTIKTMPELLTKLNKWREQRPVGQFFSVVTPQPTYLHPNILGSDIFKHDFKEILNLMPDSINYTYMEGIANDYSKSSLDAVEVSKLRTYLNEIDRRRNTTWQNVFPWLAKELEHVV